MKKMKYAILSLLIAASFAQASAQFVHEPKDGNPMADLPAFQVDFQWNNSTQQWDSLRYGTLSHHPIGLTPDVVFRPTVGSTMAHPERHLYQYDALGNMTMEEMDEDLTGQGGWVPVFRKTYQFLSGTSLITFNASEQWNGTTWDTISASQFSYTFGTGGQPTEKIISLYLAGPWSSPLLYERYHYNVSQEMDTLWFYPFMVNSVGSEMHVFQSWHDYANRLVDSATVYTVLVNGGNYELHSTHHTTYAGNTPQFYREDTYSSGAITNRQTINLTTEGFYGLDSLTSFAGQPAFFSKEFFQNGFDSLNRLSRRINYMESFSDPFVPLYMTEYIYSMTTSVEEGMALDVKVWPNPASEILKIALPEGTLGPISMQVVDLNGIVRTSQLLTTAQSVVELPLNDDLAAGTYLVRLQTLHGSAVAKVMVAR